ncbi:unnamed protein product [Lathyrus oleraceus]
MSITSSEVTDDLEERGKSKNMENHAGVSSFLIRQLGRDMSINCLVRLSRSDYGSVVALNQIF